MNRSAHRYISVLSLFGSVALASPALAQDDTTAKDLFNRGLADMEASRYATGCPALAESQRLDPRPGTLFTLSECEVRWGRVATAVTRLREYLGLYERMTPEQKERQSERYTIAKEQQEKLALEVPELTLTLPPGAPSGTVVKRDDAVVASAALGIGLPVDPGEHVVSTQAPGGTLWEQRITIVKGEKKPLVLEVKPAPTVEAQPIQAEPIVAKTLETVKKVAMAPTQEAGESRQRSAAYALGIVGVGGLVVSGVMAGAIPAKKTTIRSHCQGTREESSVELCDQIGVSAGNSVKTFGLISTVSFAVGIAGVGAAVALLMNEHMSAKPTTGKRTPWISADVLSLGPTGATLGARGSF